MVVTLLVVSIAPTDKRMVATREIARIRDMAEDPPIARFDLKNLITLHFFCLQNNRYSPGELMVLRRARMNEGKVKYFPFELTGK